MLSPEVELTAERIRPPMAIVGLARGELCTMTPLKDERDDHRTQLIDMARSAATNSILE